MPSEGTSYFMGLTTGQCLNHYKRTKLPMPQEVIEWVHVLACNNPTNPPGLVIINCDGKPDAFDAADNNKDDNGDSTYIPRDQEDDDNSLDDDNDSINDDDDNDGDNDNNDDDPSQNPTADHQ